MEWYPPRIKTRKVSKNFQGALFIVCILCFFLSSLLPSLSVFFFVCIISLCTHYPWIFMYRIKFGLIRMVSRVTAWLLIRTALLTLHCDFFLLCFLLSSGGSVESCWPPLNYSCPACGFIFIGIDDMYVCHSYLLRFSISSWFTYIYIYIYICIYLYICLCRSKPWSCTLPFSCYYYYYFFHIIIMFSIV